MILQGSAGSGKNSMINCYARENNYEVNKFKSDYYDEDDLESNDD